jgi:integrase/recombinase XerD
VTRVNPEKTVNPPLIDEEMIGDWCSWLRSSVNAKPRTIELYALAVRRLGEFAVPRSVLDLSPEEVEIFAGVWLHKRGLLAQSRKPYISALRSFFGWARGRRLLAGEPERLLRQPNVGRPLPRALSLASAEKLMWAPDLGTFLGIRDAAILGLLVGCGLRVSGLVALNQSDLRDLEVASKPRMVVRVVEKGGRERQVPVPREAEMLLRVYLDHDDLKGVRRDIVRADGRPDRVLFVNGRNSFVPAHEWHGEAVRLVRATVWKLIQRYGEKAGIPPAERHPHAFRHLFGTELAEDDVDLLTRQNLMGHVDPKSTQIYTELSMRRRMKVLDESGPLAKLKTPVSELLKRLPARA